MSTETEERVEIDVDLEKEVPCGSQKGCDNPAEWACIGRPCGHQLGLVCSKCRREDEQYVALCRMAARRLYDLNCGATLEDVTWIPL